MSTRYQQMLALRERAMNAAIEWTQRMRARNPRITFAETEAYARGFEAGVRDEREARKETR